MQVRCALFHHISTFCLSVITFFLFMTFSSTTKTLFFFLSLFLYGFRSYVELVYWCWFTVQLQPWWLSPERHIFEVLCSMSVYLWTVIFSVYSRSAVHTLNGLSKYHSGQLQTHNFLIFAYLCNIVSNSLIGFYSYNSRIRTQMVL